MYQLIFLKKKGTKIMLQKVIKLSRRTNKLSLQQYKILNHIIIIHTCNGSLVILIHFHHHHISQNPIIIINTEQVLEDSVTDIIVTL